MPLYLQNEHVLAGTDLAKVSASAIVIVIFQHAKIEIWLYDATGDHKKEERPWSVLTWPTESAGSKRSLFPDERSSWFVLRQTAARSDSWVAVPSCQS